LAAVDGNPAALFLHLQRKMEPVAAGAGLHCEPKQTYGTYDPGATFADHWLKIART
jgi:hypothetical protein